MRRRMRQQMQQARTRLCDRSGCYNPGLIVFAVARFDSDHIHHDRDKALCPEHATPILEALGSPTRPCPMAAE